MYYISGMDQPFGHANGGTRVTFLGSNFVVGQLGWATFGNQVAQATATTSTTVTVATPSAMYSSGGSVLVGDACSRINNLPDQC